MQNKLSKPKHDELFRKSLENPLVARELLESHLPAEIFKLIDINTLKIEKESFVEPDLTTSISDVLFSVKFQGQDGYIFLLLEHQSTSDYWMAFRLFKYMINICERHLTSHPNAKHLPLIYPLIIYNGTKKYTAPKNLWDLFEHSNLAKDFWIKDHKVVNVHDIPDEQLQEKIWAGLLQFFLKHIHERKLLKRWQQIANILPKLTEVRIGYDYIQMILCYTLTAIDKNDKIELNKLLIDNLNIETGEKLMTSLAEHWAQDGFEKGIQKGVQAGIQKVAINMLKSKLDIKLIAMTTGLSIEEIQKLQAQN